MLGGKENGLDYDGMKGGAFLKQSHPPYSTIVQPNAVPRYS